MNGTLLINMILASVFAGLLYVILKLFQRWNINNLQGLTFNYLSAGAFAFLLNSGQGKNFTETIVQVGPVALGLGFIFILVFYTAALTAQKAGLAVTSIAGKMSMVIPILLGIIVFHDHVDLIRITGISIALIAFYLTSISVNPDGEEKVKTNNRIYPILLFIGTGIVDSLIKISQEYFITKENENLYYTLLFGSAGFFGLIAIGYRWIRIDEKVKLKNILGGILLGITNYFSLSYLVKCLATSGAESVIVFSVVNMLVVIISSLIAFTVFGEKPSGTKVSGITLALIAILLLAR
jgi:drug/metabolite transporter (DMT)-like permease